VKLPYHQEAIARWATKVGLGFERAWQLREECIASLANNAFNTDAILTQQNAYGAAWTRPLTVIQPRFVKVAARWDF
jgi:hypothetical protein